MVRTMIEARKRGSMWFFTLTYANEHLPYLPDMETGELYPSLRRSDVKKMFHDVRQIGARKGKPLPSFAWLYSGEYGPRTNRPHYHGCFLGLPDEFVNMFKEYWSKHFGFTDFKKIPLIDPFGKDNVACVARYIAKYIAKPIQYELDIVRNKVVEKPRKVTSVGFGLLSDSHRDYILGGLKKDATNVSLNQLSKLLDRYKISFNGYDYAIPQYLIKKYFYEKNFKGNLAPSPLSYVVKAFIRSKSLDRFDETLRQLREKGCSDEVIRKVLGQIQELQELDFYNRFNSSNEDLQSFYKKSKF